MDPLMQEKLLDLAINIVSIILGGGIILLIIEWRRHQREKRVWAREDQLLEIDIPRSEVRVRKWQISDEMSDGEKVVIYENQLEGTIKGLLTVAHFVIRNTTGAEIIVTSYDVDLLQIPPSDDTKRFYDLETADLISVEDMGAIKLQPYAAIARITIVVSKFDQNRRLEEVPSTLVVEARTSSGATIHGKATLSVVPRFPDIRLYRNRWHPRHYADNLEAADKMEEEVEEIPF